MRYVREHVPGASLLIAGHDLEGHRETLQRLIDHLGLRPHVRLVGFQADVPSFLHALDVFAFPSRSEGFGQVAIEAMAAGKPVVASRIPPLTEIIVDGETGLLAEPRNPEAFARAIIRLLTDPDLARRMGAQGQKRVMELFDASVMEERTLALYRQCLAVIRGR
jgi:glycosyltransferase involved in cell wall biosynthesis